MNPVNSPSRVAASLAIAGLLAVPGAAGLFLFPDAMPVASAQSSSTATSSSTADADVTLDSQLVDESGVIDSSARSEILDLLHKGISENNIKLYLVFVESMPTQAQAYAEQLRQQDNTGNTMVLVVDTVKRQIGSNAGGSVARTQQDKIVEKAREKFASTDYTGGAKAAADEAAGTTDPASVAWLGAAGVVGIGGAAGGVVWSRRNRKNREEKQLDAARTIAPDDTADLASQPTHVLRALADEELHSTDESIRKGSEELDLAVAEFGEERTRSLSRALSNSRKTLNNAYGLHQRIRSELYADENEQRSILVEIVSTCGQADDELDARSEEFAELRRELIDAPKLVDELRQENIALRTRVPDAREKLAQLEQRYSREQLISIVDNADVAEREIEEAEKALDQARTMLNLPAGRQSGLVDALNAARMACQQADKQLAAVERAEEHMTAANRNLDALKTEVAEELAEAADLRKSGADFDRSGLDAAVARAESALQRAQEMGDTDPLGCYSELLEADGQLDLEMDEARGADNNYQRTIQVVDRTIHDVQQRLQAVEDTISNRGKIISVDTRSSARAAREALDFAVQRRTEQPKEAFLAAQRASQMATTASAQAQRDIEDFNRRNSYRGGGGGDMITGMVLGSLLSGNGGFGGGWGGGFGDGGFGGGFGGGGDFGGGGSSSF